MESQSSKHSPMACIECSKRKEPTTVNVTMWRDKQLVVIENVAAYVCHECEEQFYDDQTGAKILDLANKGFRKDKMVREIDVPVYSIDEDLGKITDEIPKGG